MREKLEERFRQKIKEEKFNTLEIIGMMKEPELCLITGMAMGYDLAMQDIENGVYYVRGEKRE